MESQILISIRKRLIVWRPKRYQANALPDRSPCPEFPLEIIWITLIPDIIDIQFEAYWMEDGEAAAAATTATVP